MIAFRGYSGFFGLRPVLRLNQPRIFVIVFKRKFVGPQSRLVCHRRAYIIWIALRRVPSGNPPPSDAKSAMLFLGVVGTQLAFDWPALTT